MTVHRADAILGLVIDIIDDSHGPFTAREITRATRPLIDPPPTLDEVAAVLDMLAHPTSPESAREARAPSHPSPVSTSSNCSGGRSTTTTATMRKDSDQFLAEIDDRY
ncbi:hypothetical protein FOH10_12070 [Nocardia otitidiscaviarum]|uniref:Uncharacterized protein n=1 Tax=Nocardia otitidiscaviarum TaxID=1823 RepID=A0A516NKA5_9NOCA|nr:hypothetical protein [Nocardia otitidiscaviarum]MCP9624817.1 hypothetical protein [Nocardia otitidiscaviarum]QDP79343.1 hypothetical protein FOH10_12070 [Nocardia otitidiscaviarum]